MAEQPRILIGGSTLFSDGGPVPRPLAKARIALERLRELGEPVVLVGNDLGGRSLPDDPRDRVAWVRERLDIPWLTVVAFDEPGAGRPMDPTTKHADGSWVSLRSTWRAESLLTSFESSVGAARRAGLNVIRIGARGTGADPTHPRADYEAIDLLDAVRHLAFSDAFDRPAAAISAGSSPAAAAPPDVLEGG